MGAYQRTTDKYHNTYLYKRKKNKCMLKVSYSSTKFYLNKIAIISHQSTSIHLPLMSIHYCVAQYRIIYTAGSSYCTHVHSLHPSPLRRAPTMCADAHVSVRSGGNFARSAILSRPLLTCKSLYNVKMIEV